MNKQAITEEMKIHKNWYEDAKKQTIKTLPEFINHLMNDYVHDYGTICHALAAGGIATMWAMNDHEQGGITGFQAGAVMWEFIRNWNYTHNKVGLRLVDFDNLLYPQYEYKFDKTISQEMWSSLKEQAEINLRESKSAHIDVVAHWEKIVNGEVPFGYSISTEN